MKFIIDFLYKIINLLLYNRNKKINIISKKEIDIEVEKNLDNNTENVCSRYFTLEEITKSNTAIRQGIQNIPSKDQIFQVQQLCSVIMDRIRDHYNKPIQVLSGYRCQELNKAVGGSKSSQHMALNNDAAIDFKFYDHNINLESVFHWITQISDIHFDQCIAEFLPEGWIHISYNLESKNNRGKITRATKVNNKTFYEQLGYAKWS